MNYPTAILSEVFRDTKGHIESAQIIPEHSTNKNDIREIALKGIDLNGCKNIIDLGCGFGFFTEALKNKVEPGTVVTGIDCFQEYRKPYLDLSRNLNFSGNFYDTGTSALNQMMPASANLVLSSFSIYFFPEIVPKVVRVLKSDGMFIVITHFSSHLKELTTLIRDTMEAIGHFEVEPLPHDKLIANFPADEAKERLSSFFAEVEERLYPNELVFHSNSIEHLLSYFLYKKSFFIPENLYSDSSFMEKLIRRISENVSGMHEFRITKNDGIYICKKPLTYENKARKI